jgi:Rod binding domain-containing protein
MAMPRLQETAPASFYGNASLNGPDREDPRRVGAQFEAIFYRMLFRQMRESSLDEGLFDGRDMEQFQEMQHNELANALGAMGELGIIDAVVKEASQMPTADALYRTGLLK